MAELEMKKAIGKIFALCLFCSIYGINYKTLESTKLYESDGTFNYYARDIDKNETMEISKAQIYYGVSGWKYSVEIVYHDSSYFTNAENLIPENTQDIFSDNISLIHSEDAKWLPAYCFDMPKEQNREVIKSKQQNGFRGYQDSLRNHIFIIQSLPFHCCLTIAVFLSKILARKSLII